MRTLLQTVTVVCLAIVALTLTGTARAQSGGGLSGKVVDSAGEPVRKVKIVVTSPQVPGFKEQAKTSKNGEFTISAHLSDGDYELRLEKSGFAPMVKMVKAERGAVETQALVLLTPNEAEAAEAEMRLELQKRLDAFNAGVEAFTAGDLETAKARIEEAYELGYDPLAALSALSLVCLKMEKYEEAAIATEKALALNAEESRALMIRYQAYEALGNEEKTAEAVAALKAAGLLGDVALVVFNEGVEFYRSGRTAPAKAKFREARDLDPDLADAHRVLGGIALQEGRYGDARKAAEKILEIVPGDAKALKMRFDAARLALNLENLGPAATDCAAVDPAYVGGSLESQADKAFEANKVDVARSLLGVLIEVLPDYARGYYRLGLCDVNTGDNAAAKRNLRKFIELAPDDPEAAVAQSMMEALP